MVILLRYPVVEGNILFASQLGMERFTLAPYNELKGLLRVVYIVIAYGSA